MAIFSLSLPGEASKSCGTSTRQERARQSKGRLASFYLLLDSCWAFLFLCVLPLSANIFFCLFSRFEDGRDVDLSRRETGGRGLGGGGRGGGCWTNTRDESVRT